MKAIEYRENYSDRRESGRKFGRLIHDTDESEAYEMDQTELRKKGEIYNILFANGCSCWDGDWSGWEMTPDELLKWASKNTSKQERYGTQSENTMADWIVENKEKI